LGSQIGQDDWVIKTLGQMRNGNFIDIGCGHFDDISNTIKLEKEYGWYGIGVDLNDNFSAGWAIGRRNSRFVACDATNCNWFTLLSGMPKRINYLSMDLEPPELTLKCLKTFPFEEYSFDVITYETDEYRELGTVEESRRILMGWGYRLVKTVNHQDDFYVRGES
jgi:hypothetical protein